MNVIFVGPPGAGKGTQATRLARCLGIPHVGSGDLLRAVRAQDTPLGHEAKEYMDTGRLVPDDLTIRIVEARLARPDAVNGVILDGFPRSLPQAERLDASLGRGKTTWPDAVVYIKASRDVVIERMAGRWICQQCGSVYHIPAVAPSAIGRCDVCGAPLVQRSDETPAIQAVRYDVYEHDTLPLIDYYQQRGVLVEIDGEQGVDAVTGDISAAIEEKRGARPVASGSGSQR